MKARVLVLALLLAGCVTTKPTAYRPCPESGGGPWKCRTVRHPDYRGEFRVPLGDGYETERQHIAGLARLEAYHGMEGFGAESGAPVRPGASVERALAQDATACVAIVNGLRVTKDQARQAFWNCLAQRGWTWKGGE